MMREDDCVNFFFIIKVAGKRVVERDLQGVPHTGGREGEAWVYGYHSLYHRSIAQKVKHLETMSCAVVMSEKCLVLAGGCVFTTARKFRTQELPGNTLQRLRNSKSPP